MKDVVSFVARHPWARLLIAISIAFLNFLMLAEDPVAHSPSPAVIPLIGTDVTMLVNRYPPNAFSLLKFVLAAGSIVAGCFFGLIIIHHWLLRDRFRLVMFAQSKGTWMIMFITCFVSIYTAAALYNLILMSWDGYMEWRVTDDMRMTNETFMRLAACGTWLGDYITAFMVVDIMLQDATQYPSWARAARRFWTKGSNRIVIFWVCTIGLSAIVITGISTDWLNWDELGNGWAPSTELTRALLASFITLMDLMILMQDWDFPLFETPMDVTINLPGLNVSSIKFKLPEFLDKIEVKVTGKWFQFGIIFLVMCLDLNMLKNQIVYEPADFNQYVDPEGYIYTVEDLSVTPSELNWETRGGVGDMRMESRYMNYSLTAKGFAAFPAVFGLAFFLYLVYRDGQKGTVTARMARAKDRAIESGIVPGETTDGADEKDDAASAHASASTSASSPDDGGKSLSPSQTTDASHIEPIAAPLVADKA